MFPLGTVLLPHNALPLHVFEPRYRAMIDRVLDGDQQFGVVLIERGSEVGGDDVRTDVGCLARIREIQQFADGRYALVATGTERVRVNRWLADDPHPWAEIEVWEHGDDLPPADEIDATMSVLRQALALAAEIGDAVAPATIELDVGAAEAIDIMAGLAPLGPLDRQALLTCEDRVLRCRQLRSFLDDRLGDLRARLES